MVLPCPEGCRSVIGVNAFRSLRSLPYRVWAVGALISNTGTWVQRTAQDWLVLAELTPHNAQAVGIVMSLQFGPQLLLLPWTGFAADHFDRRRLMMLTQAALGLLALALGVLTLTGVVRLWMVDGFALLSGCAAAFDTPARQTFVAELVEDRDLANAVALNSTSFNSARMVGPALAGLMIAGIGTGWAFVVNGASFAAVLVSLVLLGRMPLRTEARAARTRGSLIEGFRYVAKRPDLLAMLGMLFLVATFGLNLPLFISTMAVTVFHQDAARYGLLSSALALGTIVGALGAAGRERPLFRHLVGGSALFGVGLAVAAIAPSPLWFALTLVVVGVAALTVTNTSNTLVQLSTEPTMRGRIMAIRLAIALGCTPLGAPLVGWVADAFGPRWALGVGAASGFAAALLGLAYLRRARPASAVTPGGPPIGA